MTWIALLLTLLGGAGLSVQAGVNAQFGQRTGAPVWGTLFSIAVTAVTLVLAALILRPGAPNLAGLRGAPFWIFTGGLYGALILLVGATFAPKLGAAFYSSVVIAGQLLAALLLDQFGVLGFALHAVSPGRILGALLLVIGVVCIRVF
ncbi:MAG TPA: DMT family transporter [Deinococcales bacterium]|nr:DMT family transporter [Deinococcales bacterium]